jgi:hypothetical protein
MRDLRLSRQSHYSKHVHHHKMADIIQAYGSKTDASELSSTQFLGYADISLSSTMADLAFAIWYFLKLFYFILTETHGFIAPVHTSESWRFALSLYFFYIQCYEEAAIKQLCPELGMELNS